MHTPTDPTHLIGPIRDVVGAYLHEFRTNAARNERPPFKLLLLGEPGRGKSAGANILAAELAGTDFNIERLNGTDLTIDRVREIKARFPLSNLWGGYQGLIVDELENATPKAQVDMLTMLDRLPSGWFFIGTTNNVLDDFEPRFQTRFEQVPVGDPQPAEIEDLITRLHPGIPAAIAHQIAELATGNVRAALLDAKQWLTVEAYRLAQAA